MFNWFVSISKHITQLIFWKTTHQLWHQLNVSGEQLKLRVVTKHQRIGVVELPMFEPKFHGKPAPDIVSISNESGQGFRTTPIGSVVKD